MRIERELMRGAAPLAVLKLLERTEMYGYELIEALTTHTQGVLTMGQSTLYPLLYNLEAKGFIEGHWREKDSPGARKRKYYALTGKGKNRLAKDSSQWLALARAMASLGIAPATPDPASMHMARCLFPSSEAVPA